MIRYLIIDDEYIAHDIIKGYCDMLPNMELKKNCYDALEAFEYLNEHPVDLIFLDLNMPKLKGFDFLRTLDTPPKVIVTTAYSEHALEGFELNVVDYLLKPFSFERFLKAVKKVSPKRQEIKEVIAPVIQQEANRFFIKGDKKMHQVNEENILFIEAFGNYTKLFLIDSMIVCNEKISDFEQRLPKKAFIRVHKSFMVAVDKIASIEHNKIHILTHKIPIGLTYKSVVNSLYNN